LNENNPLFKLGALRLIAAGATTLICTSGDVAETPLAVATAVNVYDPGSEIFPVTRNGLLVALPRDAPLAKYSTLLMLPELTLALAVRSNPAGAEKLAPSEGLMMLTVGVGGAGGFTVTWIAEEVVESPFAVATAVIA